MPSCLEVKLIIFSPLLHPRASVFPYSHRKAQGMVDIERTGNTALVCATRQRNGQRLNGVSRGKTGTDRLTSKGNVIKVTGKINGDHESDDDHYQEIKACKDPAT